MKYVVYSCVRRPWGCGGGGDTGHSRDQILKMKSRRSIRDKDEASFLVTALPTCMASLRHFNDSNCVTCFLGFCILTLGLWI